MDKIRTTLQRLKPLYSLPEQLKIDMLWMRYKSADYKERQEIEQLINRLATSHGLEGVDEQIILPPPPETDTEGVISIGKVMYLDKQLFDYKLKLSELTRHAGIFGSTGTGKTTLARQIIKSLVENKVPFIIFDWEKSYRGLIKEFPAVKLYTIGRDAAPLRFNFFKVPPGIGYKEYVKSVIEVFNKAYVGGVGSDTILKRVFDAAYSMNRLPLLSEVKSIIDMSMRGRHNMRGREMLWKQSAMRMIEFMLYGGTGEMYCAQNADSIETLFDNFIVFELGGLANSNDKRFFTEIITLWYTLYLEHKGIEDETLKHALIFEEFHNIVENSEKEDLIVKSFRQLRKYGTGMIALDQTPSQIPNSIFENMGTKITFSLDHHANVRAVANAMYMDKDQVGFIGLLRIGQAIVRAKERYPYPFLISVPFGGKTVQLSDEDIRAHMKPFLHLSKSDKPAINVRQTIQTSPGYEYTPHTGALILLQEIAVLPFLGTDERYKKLGISSRIGTGFKEKLIDNGYLRPVQVDRKVLYELTDKARTYLRLRKIKIPVQARGGIEHNFWLEKLKDHFRARNGFPFKEKDDIDLVVEYHDSTTLIQVETGKSDIQKNIKTMLEKNCDSLMMIATNRPAEAKIRNIISDSSLPGREKIQVHLAKDFLSNTP